MQTLNPPIVYGPHCWHDDCSMAVCDMSGYAEYPCQAEGCPVCGAPSVGTPEAWGGLPARFMDLTPEEMARVRAYWDAYPLLRRADDVQPVIPAERLEAARAVNGGGRG